MMPRGPVTSNLPPAMEELLRLAGVPPSNRKAMAWLNDAIDQARSRYRVAKQRPLPADHNALLADIDKSAKKLTKQIERLRRTTISMDSANSSRDRRICGATCVPCYSLVPHLRDASSGHGQ